MESSVTPGVNQGGAGGHYYLSSCLRTAGG